MEPLTTSVGSDHQVFTGQRQKEKRARSTGDRLTETLREFSANAKESRAKLKAFFSRSVSTTQASTTAQKIGKTLPSVMPSVSAQDLRQQMYRTLDSASRAIDQLRQAVLKQTREPAVDAEGRPLEKRAKRTKKSSEPSFEGLQRQLDLMGTEIASLAKKYDAKLQQAEGFSSPGSEHIHASLLRGAKSIKTQIAQLQSQQSTLQRQITALSPSASPIKRLLAMDESFILQMPPKLRKELLDAILYYNSPEKDASHVSSALRSAILPTAIKHAIDKMSQIRAEKSNVGYVKRLVQGFFHLLTGKGVKAKKLSEAIRALDKAVQADTRELKGLRAVIPELRKEILPGEYNWADAKLLLKKLIKDEGDEENKALLTSIQSVIVHRDYNPKDVEKAFNELMKSAVSEIDYDAKLHDLAQLKSFIQSVPTETKLDKLRERENLLTARLETIGYLER